MNIQQALRKAAEIRARIFTLETRIKSDILVEVGAQPKYDGEALKSMLEELDKDRFELQSIKGSIDAANHIVGEDGDSVCSLLLLKSTMSDRLAFWTVLRQTEADRYAVREGTKFERRIADTVMDDKIDLLISERRKVDDRVCEKNAKTSV